MKITAFEIIKAVGHELEIEDITLKSNEPTYTHARFLVIGLIRRYTKLHPEAVAALIKRDISTVYWGEKRYADLLSGKYDEGFRHKYIRVHKRMEELCNSN